MHGWCLGSYENGTKFCTNIDRTILWRPMAGQELRRSYTQIEIPVHNRERYYGIRHVAPAPLMFQIPQQHGHQVPENRRFSGMPSSRVRHATMEIYRPPNVRADGTSSSPPGNNIKSKNSSSTPRLNVHAKEFMMHRDLQTSRSSSNIPIGMNVNSNGSAFPQSINGKGYALQYSKSSGNVLHALQHSKSSGNILHSQSQMMPPRVHFRIENTVSEDNNEFMAPQHKSSLKRSKSMGATDALRKTTNADLAVFPAEMHDLIEKAVQDPNELSARTLMQLVKLIMERATDNRRYAEPAAKLCINIIEKEKKETFLESLLNMCQLWYQEREKLLKSKNPQFMGFLNEMYCQLKRSQLQLKTHYDGVPPPLLLLTLLSKCCQDCLKPPAVQSLSETECLFFVLTSIGRDLEQELPKELDQVLSGVRDAFLTAATTPAIRKTLLQLIELHAAKWQLPASAVMYYYPGTTR